MFRPHGRYKAIEHEFLSGDDLSVCPVCGDSEHIWHGFESGAVTSFICTHCGWVCGNATFLDAIQCKLINTIYRIKNVLVTKPL